MCNIKVSFRWGQTVNTFSPEFMNFSAGEVHLTAPISIKMKDNLDEVWVISSIKSSEDLMKTLVVTNAIRHEVKYGTKVNLLIPYLPYSRSDRVCSKGEEFGLEVFAKTINSMGYDKVVTFDAHSEVVTSLIHFLKNVHMKWLFEHYLTSNNLKYDLLISPDDGSFEKGHACSYVTGIPVTQGYKKRDPSTGKLSGFGLIEGELIAGRKVLIIDDLCDGGGTFIGLLEEIKKYSPKSVDLLVTHGIFSKGVEVLTSAGFNKVTAINYFDESLVDNNTLDTFISYITQGDTDYE